MPTRSNQDIERFYFGQFETHFPTPAGRVEYADKPDVVIYGDRRLGIEIANLYLVDGADPTSEQRQRESRAEVLQQAQAAYLSAGGRNIELTVQFNAAKPIFDVQMVATALARLASSVERLPAGSINRSVFRAIPEIGFIYHNPREYTDARWRLGQGYYGQQLSVARVREVVDLKHEKLPAYKPCDAYWLLLIVEFFDSAQDQEIDWPASAGSIDSRFERIIIYKPAFGSWVDVSVNN